MSPYFASVINIPKYFPKCSAISLDAQPRKPRSIVASPTPPPGQKSPKPAELTISA